MPRQRTSRRVRERPGRIQRPDHIRRLSKAEQYTAVLLCLAWFDQLTRAQLSRLLLIPENTLQARLTKNADSLTNRGLIERIDTAAYDADANVPERTKSRYRLTEPGHAHIKTHAQYPANTLGQEQQYPARPNRIREDQDTHSLWVVETLISIIEAARERLGGLAGLFIQYELKVNPYRRAPYADAVLVLHAARDTPMTEPLPFTPHWPTDGEHYATFLLEVDMDTEPRATIAGKAQSYALAFEDPRWRAHWREHWGDPLRVLWLVPDQPRQQAVATLWAERVPPETFLLTTFDQLHANIWQRTTDDAPQSVRLIATWQQRHLTAAPAPVSQQPTAAPPAQQSTEQPAPPVSHKPAPPPPAQQSTEQLAPTTSAAPVMRKPADPAHAAPSPGQAGVLLGQSTANAQPAPPVTPKAPPEPAPPQASAWQRMGQVLLGLLMLAVSSLVLIPLLTALAPLVAQLWQTYWLPLVIAGGVVLVLLGYARASDAQRARLRHGLAEEASALLWTAGMVSLLLLLFGGAYWLLWRPPDEPMPAHSPFAPPPSTATPDPWQVCAVGEVLADGLRARRGPGVQYPVLGAREGDPVTYQAGQTVAVLCGAPVQADGYRWRRIFPWDGAVIAAWVAVREDKGRRLVELRDTTAAP